MVLPISGSVHQKTSERKRNNGHITGYALLTIRLPDELEGGGSRAADDGRYETAVKEIGKRAICDASVQWNELFLTNALLTM
ncbi:hypothetical protein M514_05424 [Trichuris suis]|uniref:Uncharacterized protein n=1 Tax=Trichuris suis TaxID=68888 RepID=A0A085NSI8_9BILA|nr:hypothetical protein M513_05424 [Trichuris suis]KFD72434.1 hypothetical protein M514_05424 [Trichuris suis]